MYIKDHDLLLGNCEITAKDLVEKGGQTELEIVLDGNPTDTYLVVNAEMFNLSKKTTSFSLPEYDGVNKLCGLLTIIVTKAFDIPIPKEGKHPFSFKNKTL